MKFWDSLHKVHMNVSLGVEYRYVISKDQSNDVLVQPVGHLHSRVILQWHTRANTTQMKECQHLVSLRADGAGVASADCHCRN